MISRRKTVFLLAALPALASFRAGADEVPGDQQAKGEHEVIVIGAGMAGLAAAVSAAEHGAKGVLVLDKAPIVGGRAIYADGTISAVYPRFQKPAHIEDSPELMARQIWEWGGRKGNLRMLRILAEHSEHVIDWMRGMGVNFLNDVFAPYPATFPRGLTSHRNRGGYEYIEALNRRARALGCQILLNRRVTGILKNSAGAVSGVSYTDKAGNHLTAHAKTVIITTGGYTGNPEMLLKYANGSKTSLITNERRQRFFEGATGDGIQMAEAAGAELCDMHYTQLSTLHGGKMLDYAGGDIYVNEKGVRFIAEDAGLTALQKEIEKQPGKIVWAITDSHGDNGTLLTERLVSGDVLRAETIDQIALGIGVRPAILKETLKRYNGFVRAQKDGDFGKKVLLQEISTPPYYYGRTYQDPHYTMGGIKINERAQVIDRHERPIPGLFAAGETTGGTFGNDRPGGTAFTDCLVFGRMAGKEAAAYAKRPPPRKHNKYSVNSIRYK